MDAAFNPEMLNLARELVGMTQVELSQVTGIHPASLSRYEAGLVLIPSDELTIVAKALGFPVAFFYRKGHRYDAESGEVFHRKRNTVPLKQLKSLYATMDLYRLNLEILLSQVDVETPYLVPDYNLQVYKGDIGDIAMFVRASWNMPLGYVRNFTEVLERACCMVFELDFGTDKLDEVTQWVEPMPPIILVNTRVPVERRNFSLAHSLGHLVMHHGLMQYPGMEREADLFAAEFLMPARDIRQDLKPVSLEHLLGIKPLWKVSVEHLLNRARDLKLINETRHTTLNETLSRKGWKANEPVPLPPEPPKLFSQLLSLYLDDRRYTTQELAQFLDVYSHQLEAWYMPQPAIRLIPKVKGAESTG